MASLIQYLIDLHNYISYDMPGIRMKEYQFMGSPLPIFGLILVYFYFCFRAGPRWMKNRNPYNLTKIMIAYNLFQVLSSVWFNVMILISLYEYFYELEGDGRCYSLESLKHLSDQRLEAFISKADALEYIYIWLKVMELVDTVFMVLKKNFHQVSYLHLYHHSSMALNTWLLGKYFDHSHEFMVPLVNTVVHTVMYSYYLACVLNSETKRNIALKKSITRMQLGQFVLVVLFNVYALTNWNCPTPKIHSIYTCLHAIIMTVLFSNFYLHAYTLPKKEDKREDIGNYKRKLQ